MTDVKKVVKELEALGIYDVKKLSTIRAMNNYLKKKPNRVWKALRKAH